MSAAPSTYEESVLQLREWVAKVSALYNHTRHLKRVAMDETSKGVLNMATRRAQTEADESLSSAVLSMELAESVCRAFENHAEESEEERAERRADAHGDRMADEAALEDG